MCAAGYFCFRGTPNYSATRNKCGLGYFCPEGTASGSAIETKCPRLTTSSAGAGRLEQCKISEVDVCDKIDFDTDYPYTDVSYYPKHNYELLDGSGSRIYFDSEASIDPTGEVEVVKKINPINESASSAYWVNETIEIFRTCLSYGSSSGGQDLFVIGRNFYETGASYCRYTPCLSSDVGLRRCYNKDGSLGSLGHQSMIEEAVYESPTRFKCKSPSYDFTIPVNQTDFDEECVYLPSIADYGYIHDCSRSDLDCIANFTTPVVTCTENELTTGTCTNFPDEGRKFNPCLAGEVLVDVTNDGWRWSSENMTIKATSLEDSVYNEYTNIFVDSSYAVFTVLRSDVFPSSSNDGRKIKKNDLEVCKRPTLSEEFSRDREEGWFMLRSLDTAHIVMDFKHLPDDFVYAEHYKIGIYARPSRCNDELCNENRVRLPPEEQAPCRQPVELPHGLTDTSVPKNRLLNISVTALDDVIIKVEVHILHGLFLPFEPFFMNSTTVTIVHPSRANDTAGGSSEYRSLSPYVSWEERIVRKNYFFGVVYEPDAATDITPPLNLPPRYKDYERGRVLVGFNTSHESLDVPVIRDPFDEVDQSTTFWSGPAATGEENKVLQDVYFETFHSISYQGNEFVYDFESLLVPYFLFFSNCHGPDSYLMTYTALESEQCYLPKDENDMGVDWYRYAFPPLPHQDDIDFVDSFDIGASPVSDWCEIDFVCHYEEDLPSATVAPRWFEAGSGNELFSIIRQPISYEEYVGRSSPRHTQRADLGGSSTVKRLDVTIGSDVFVGVSLNTDAADDYNGDCDVLCYPRKMTMEILYHQKDEHEKMITSIELVMENFDKDDTNTEYEFHISYYALNYLELIIAFAHEPKVFIVLFVAIGVMGVLVLSSFWFVTRITTQLEVPPNLNFFSYFGLVVPNPTAGILLALIPISIVTGILAVYIKGDKLIYGEIDATGTWMLDTMKVHFMDVRVNVNNIEKVRSGRMGAGFFFIGFYSIISGSRFFIPRRESKRLKELEFLRDKRADDEDIWDSTLWKRSNMVFASYLMAMLNLVIIEFSYWGNFGSYIWTIIFLLKVADQFIGTAVEGQLGEALLINAVSTAGGIAQGLIWLAADDFQDFLLGFFVDLGIGLTETMYIDPSLGDVLDWISETVSSIIDYFKEEIPKWLYGMSLTRDKSKRRQQEDEDEDAKKAIKREVDLVGEDGDTVEPLMDSFGGWTCGIVELFYSPFNIYLLMLFRTETGMPDLYNIKEQDMAYYLWFGLVVILFQFISDIFLHGALEQFYGWKIHDYLVYTRYRFLQRESRWKGNEDSLDESIEESMRSLDQLCFSSQYYLIMTIHVNGIIYVVLSMEMMIRNEYNMFGDPAVLMISALMLISCVVIEKLSIFLAKRFNLWKIKHENTAWHLQMDEEEEEVDIPGWDEIQGASHDNFMMNQRITSETFRYKFLNYNRNWLIAQLPSLLTPRTLRRSRPYLVNQFQKILSSQNDLISSDSDQEGEEAVKEAFGPVALTTTSRNIIRFWLYEARKRLRLKAVVMPLISRSKQNQCESCLSRKKLHVDYEITMEDMISKFEELYGRESEEDFDQVAWKAFWMKNQVYHTLCLDCKYVRYEEEKDELIMDSMAGRSSLRFGGRDADGGEGEDDLAQGPQFGPVFLNPTSKAILLSWYRKAQRSLENKLGRKLRRKVQVLDISDDEDSDEERAEKDLTASSNRFAHKVIRLSPSSKAILQKWLVMARNSLIDRNARLGQQVTRPKPKGRGKSRTKFK
jgi:hypothetical protein